jgi:hypothetical protein
MADMFEDRERAYEAKWAHDEEAHFRIMARRDAGLGAWAAARMKLSAAESVAYAGALVQAGVAGKGTEPVLEKIRVDFQTCGAVCPEAELLDQAKMLYAEAEEYFGAVPTKSIGA